VLVNYGTRPIETSVAWSDSSRARNVEICQPYQEDRLATLPVRVQLPPQSCVVVVDSPGAR
jgi:hypothetical protein